jgi:two-component system KDP operon response regulator KdpE
MLGQVVVLVADEPDLRRSLRVAFNQHGAQLLECRRAHEGVRLLEQQRPDLVLLDLRSGELSGLAATQLLRANTDAPLIALSDCNDEEQKIAVYDAGADDYLLIPFSTREMFARLRAALRRALQSDAHKPRGCFRLGILEVDFAAHEVKLHGKSVHLTPTEYKLLGVLIASAGQVVTHQRLLLEVWGPSAVDQIQYLRVYMKQLRRKLEQAPKLPQYLVTEPAIGYRLRMPA